MRLRGFVRTGIGVVLIAVVALGIYYWQQAHIWPFSWGSKDEAFLGTTFGMSRQEAARALAKHHAQLLTYSDYRRVSADFPLIIDPFDFTPLLNSDERDSYSMYMPSIEMFDAITEAEFEFTNSRLHYVSVHFMNTAKPQSVVDSVTNALEKHYTLLRREESNSVPGAYSLHFQSTSVTPSLWVNLTDHKKPIISLSIIRPSDQSEREQKIRAREQSAFGH